MVNVTLLKLTLKPPRRGIVIAVQALQLASEKDDL